jgi:hypothetical protein
MDATVADAVQALNSAVSALIPPPADPAHTPDILINPVKTHPAGIGGYVGMHPSPLGEIFSRRLKAQVVVRVKADSVADLSAAEITVTSALVAADQTRLRSQGIYQISRDTGFGEVFTAIDDGIDTGVGKDIRFDVDYEYTRLPDAPSGVIEELPLDLLLKETDSEPRVLYDEDFDTDPLAVFTAIDDPEPQGGPSNWIYNDIDGRVEQTSTIRGGSNLFNASKRGTCLVLQASIVPAAPTDWVLYAEIGAEVGGIGVVFNFVDIDNYHYFVMNRESLYRLCGKRVNGTFSFLDAGGQDDGNGYEPGDYSLRIIQQNGELQIAIDNQPIFTASEDTPPPAGSVGFFCRNSPTARFRSLRWIAL